MSQTLTGFQMSFLALLFFFCFLFSSHLHPNQSSDFSDISESAADYFSRSNRRGSIVSDLDDLSIPDLDAVSAGKAWKCRAANVTA